MRIHELRDMARHIGVKSPTSLSKSVMIKKMLAILDGKDKPYCNAAKQGRPPKNNTKVKEIVDIFVPKKEPEDCRGGYDNNRLTDAFSFSVNSMEETYDASAVAQEKSGYLDIKPEGYGFIYCNGIVSSSDDIFLHITQIKHLGLKQGDKLCGEVRVLKPQDLKVMSKVTSINNKSIAEYGAGAEDRFNFDQSTYAIPTTRLKFDDAQLAECGFLEGARNFNLRAEDNNLETILNYAKALSSNYEVFVLNLNAKPEEENLLIDNVNIYNINFNAKLVEVAEGSNLLVEVCKRRVEDGKEVVLIINNISVLLNAFNNINQEIYSTTLSSRAIENIKNYIMCAKNISENQTLTLVAFQNLNIQPNIKDFILIDFATMFNVVVS